MNSSRATSRPIATSIPCSAAGRWISIGVNFNIDKICNFDCIYCQVVRGELKTREFVELARLGDELDQMVELVASGKIFEVPPFQHTPGALRRVNDIALSGDGEPTTFTNLGEVVNLFAQVRRRHGLDPLKLVLITNASMFHRDAVRRLEVLDANNGEIWASSTPARSHISSKWPARR